MMLLSKTRSLPPDSAGASRRASHNLARSSELRCGVGGGSGRCQRASGWLNTAIPMSADALRLPGAPEPAAAAVGSEGMRQSRRGPSRGDGEFSGVPLPRFPAGATEVTDHGTALRTVMQDEMRRALVLEPDWPLVWPTADPLNAIQGLLVRRYGPGTMYRSEWVRLPCEVTAAAGIQAAPCARCRIR